MMPLRAALIKIMLHNAIIAWTSETAFDGQDEAMRVVAGIAQAHSITHIDP